MMLEYFIIYLPVIGVFIIIKLCAPATKNFWEWNFNDILYFIFSIPIGLAIGWCLFFLYAMHITF